MVVQVAGPGLDDRSADGSGNVRKFPRAGTWTDPERGQVQVGDYATTWVTQRAGLGVLMVRVLGGCRAGAGTGFG